jgi:hypothetical protein
MLNCAQSNTIDPNNVKLDLFFQLAQKTKLVVNYTMDHKLWIFVWIVHKLLTIGNNYQDNYL